LAAFLNVLASLREQMESANLSRSDVLKALIWPLGILVSATIALVWADAPNWLLLVFVGVFVAAAALYGWSYAYCLLYDRDALRSEKFAIQKTAIERGIYGDNHVGIIEMARNVPSLPVSEIDPGKKMGSSE